ncbi:MAG: hypothetical protein ACE5I2_05445 [Anaerolineae bacterium]
MKLLRRTVFLFSLGLLLLLSAQPAQTQRGALILQQNLAELVEEAETIVVGHVLSARAEKHPQFKNLNTVVVTLRVSDVWKGAPGPTFTFRQYVWDIRDVGTTLGYGKGQEVLLLLIKPSRYGLSSPAGLDQGRFRILRDRQGKRFVVNGYQNRGLFRGVSAQARQKGIDLSSGPARLVETHQRGPVALDQLKTLVQQLARTN